MFYLWYACLDFISFPFVLLYVLYTRINLEVSDNGCFLMKYQSMKCSCTQQPTEELVRVSEDAAWEIRTASYLYPRVCESHLVKTEIWRQRSCLATQTLVKYWSETIENTIWWYSRYGRGSYLTSPCRWNPIFCYLALRVLTAFVYWKEVFPKNVSDQSRLFARKPLSW